MSYGFKDLIYKIPQQLVHIEKRKNGNFSRQATKIVSIYY